MKPLFPRNRRYNSFTLVELLVVIAIIALLGALFNPALQQAIRKAQSMKCVANLRTIGSAVLLYAGDNNNTLPQIDQAALPIYTPLAQGLVGVLGPYGVSSNIIICPIDAANGSLAACNTTTYPNPGSSYEWDPVFDDEAVNATAVYITPTTIKMLPTSRVRLAMDFKPIHNGKSNVVYADGHVVAH